MNDQKLTDGQKNILGLIRKGAKEDGWAPVSKFVAPLFTRKHSAQMPTELCEFEQIGEGGRARLTDKGNAVLDRLTSPELQSR
jgi:hypothetical protein